MKMNNKHVLSEDDIRIPPERDVAKALSIDPNDIIGKTVESIGVCYRCKKPIKDWSEGGINHFSLKADSYSYPYCQTVLLCSDCGWKMHDLVMDFIYMPIDKQ